MNFEPDVILVVEDNEDYALLIQHGFKQARLANPVFRVSNGEEAIQYLKGEGKFSNRDEHPLPSLMLLDLKMPRKNGFEVLEWLRQQPELKALRVVVLTTSEELKNVTRAYQLGANSFLLKPVNFIDLVPLVQAVNSYWMLMSPKPTISRSPERQLATFAEREKDRGTRNR